MHSSRLATPTWGAIHTPTGWAWTKLGFSSGFLVLVLTVAAAGLRLYLLGNRGLWVDELLAAETNQLPSLAQVIANTPLDHMPLDLVISWLVRFTGNSEFALRLPSAIFGIALVPAVYLLGRRLLDPWAAVIGAVLVAVAPFAVWYSQEVSPYSLLLLLVTLQAWAAHRAAEKARLIDWLLLASVTALALYAHYVAALSTVAIFTWIAFELGLQARERGQPKALIVRYLGLATAGMFALLPIAIWTPAIRAFLAAGAGAQAAKYTSPGNPISSLSAVLDGLGLGLLMVCVLLVGLWTVRRRRSMVLIFWLVLPVVAWAAMLGGGLTTILPRYLAEIWPAAILITAAGASALGRTSIPRLRVSRATTTLVVVALLLVESAPTLVRWYGEPKDDWRGAAAVLARDTAPGGAILTLGAGSDWAAPSIRWYLDRDGVHRLVVDAGGSSSDNRSTTEATAVLIRAASGPAFGVFASDRQPESSNASGRSQSGAFTHVPRSPGFIRTNLVGVTLVRAPDAIGLLRWAGGFVPGALATDAQVENRYLPDQLLPPAADLGPFLLHSDGPLAERTWTATASPGDALVARFHCVSAGDADARIYVSAHDRAGNWLALYPSNAGYRCTGTDGAFGFALPARTASVKLWLRVTGPGTGYFQDVHLARVPRL